MQEEIKAKIEELKQRYTKLALSCRASGIKVNQQTITAYMKEIQALEARL